MRSSRLWMSLSGFGEGCSREGVVSRVDGLCCLYITRFARFLYVQ